MEPMDGIAKDALQLVPLYVTLSIPREDASRLYRWRAYWCAATVTMLLLDVLGCGGLLTRCTTVLLLSADDARAAEYLMDLVWTLLRDLRLEERYHAAIRRAQILSIRVIAATTAYCTERNMGSESRESKENRVG